jgi:hypothetical protein
MHSDTITGDGPGNHRMRGALPRQQGDGRKPLPHVLTGLLTLVLTLLAGHFSHILQGQQGPQGTTTVVSKAAQDYGICAYFGPDKKGRTRLQLTEPVADAAGSYCIKGTLISVIPAKK